MDAELRRACFGIAARYGIEFLETGADRAHVHFLVQSVPALSPSKIVQTVKSITAREALRRVPSVRADLWGGAFWPWGGYYVNTVGRHGSEAAIRAYVAGQGRGPEYRPFHAQQRELF